MTLSYTQKILSSYMFLTTFVLLVCSSTQQELVSRLVLSYHIGFWFKDVFFVFSLVKRVDNSENSVSTIVSKVESVLVKLETMELAKTKRRETMSRLIDSIGDYMQGNVSWKSRASLRGRGISAKSGRHTGMSNPSFLSVKVITIFAISLCEIIRCLLKTPPLERLEDYCTEFFIFEYFFRKICHTFTQCSLLISPNIFILFQVEA